MITYKSYENLSTDIRLNMHIIQQYNFDLIVGLPRSGLIPATMIGLYLNIHCIDLNSFINNVELKSGNTRKPKFKDLKFPHQAKKILVLDDSINTGSSLKNDLELIPNILRENLVTCAIYATERERVIDVDFYLKQVSLPRVFEWNIFHHGIVRDACFDIDGVLCKDPTEEENDDGQNYINFVLDAPKLFIPTGKVFALVTSRLEKYREQTEAWLDKNGVIYEHLIMLDLPNKEERQKTGVHGKHKANFYKNSNSKLFYESDYNQSLEILHLANKPVFCVDRNIMLVPGGIYKLKTTSKNRIKKIMHYVFHKETIEKLKKILKKT